MPFVFDSSSFRVLQNYYPQRFPTFWVKFNALVVGGEIISVREVSRELETLVTKEWFLDWYRTHKSIFHAPTQPESDFVREIFAIPHFQNLVAQRQRLKGMPVADPFVVASARVRSGSVVTEESSKPNAAKIPNVCDRFGIEWMNLEALLGRLGWRF